MPDMLVKLYELPPLDAALAQQQAQGITIRRALVLEKQLVTEWVCTHFSRGWGNECDVAFSRQPVSCFIAIKENQLLGFACHDATCRNFFGPMGVGERCRGRGVGKALLLACLHGMKEQGYAYGVIGWVGPAEFYRKIVGAVEIEGSSPGIYAGLLRGAIDDSLLVIDN
ncbi:GNAT family N-acetyltransferase [candidate division KSB3 bacterium]|uniref:GNAT family N-acetyltransferase n=1 Tax=candidate division KSB3 bacterium TaxID=2044937 RepID=A0A2G6KCC3_9BACT|nr:MAG: GNAT family N-acetyltransferase [candidate division KSB3 bacterium]